MYLHLGNETVIKNESIIGVFDIDTSTVSKHTRDFLKNREKSGKIEYIGFDLPKSFVLCGKNKKDEKIYISQISSSTLYKRFNKSQL